MSPEPGVHLEELERSVCLELLGLHGVGRVAFLLDGRPAIFPVNYAVAEGAVFLCIGSTGDLARGTADSTVAFEVDGQDAVYHEGWSVLVVGRSVHVPDSAEVERFVERIGVSAWARREQGQIVRIAMDRVTGRGIRHSGGAGRGPGR